MTSSKSFEFLLRCRDSNVIPNFLNFRVSSHYLKASLTYRQCQLKLLQEEIRHKKSDIRVLKKEFNSSHSSLQHEISFIDFAHLSSLLLKSNNSILASKSAIQQKQLSNLVKSSISMDDPSKVIFNFSNELSDCEKRLLAKGGRILVIFVDSAGFIYIYIYTHTHPQFRTNGKY